MQLLQAHANKKADHATVVRLVEFLLGLLALGLLLPNLDRELGTDP